MTTDISSTSADTAGASTENVSSNVDTANQATQTTLSTDTTQQASGANNGAAQPAQAGATNAQTPVVGADGKTTYVPNFKYKAANQEKEIDPFFRSLIKDADSEKKLKDLFSKVDAFDFVKGKREAIEQEHNALLNDYGNMSKIVTNFNQSLAKGDLSSAFRLAGISKEQIFKWTQQQINLMEMPPDQRAQYEKFEQEKAQKFELEEKYSQLQQQFENTAVQARTMQLDVTLSRPDVAKFADAWDKNSEPGAFRNFVAEEARKVFYETSQTGKPVDLSPEQAVAMVMQRFGKFFNVGDTAVQSPQAIQGNGQRQAPPVIPNITGKAASPIKKVPRSLDDLRKLAREARD